VIWGNRHIKERYLYYNYVKEENTSYAIEYINGDWYEVNLNKDRKFYTKPSLRLQQEDAQHPQNVEYKQWKTLQTHETEASSSSNLITSSEQANVSEELPAQTSTLDDTLADTFLANPVFKDIAKDTEIQQPHKHYLPTAIPPPRLRFANMVDPISDPQSALNNPRPMAPFAEAVGQINQDTFAGLNPDAIQYLLRALNQYARIPGNNPKQLQPQEDPPTNQQAETEGGLKGCVLKPFTGKRSRALDFLSDFNTYWISNDNNVSMKVPYQQVALCLRFLEGDKIRKWKDDQLRTLQDEIRVRMSCNNEQLWDNFKKSFINSFVDTAVKEYAIREFNRLEQKGDEIDDYIVRFIITPLC